MQLFVELEVNTERLELNHVEVGQASPGWQPTAIDHPFVGSYVHVPLCMEKLYL